MDFLDLIVGFFNLTDSSSIVKKNIAILFDSNEYFGERVKSFFCITFLILAYLAFIFIIIYLVYYFLKSK